MPRVASLGWPRVFVLAVVLAVAGGGCASTGSLLSTTPTVQDAEPWELPTSSFPTQRLYRIKYRGPEGDFGFKLVLYLESAERYRMLATDLGRKLWTLSVDGNGRGLWLDHKNKLYCRSDAASELRFVPLADLPLIALPKLLLGRLPASPSTGLAQDATRLNFVDVRGRQWSAALTDTQPDWWSLSEGGEPLVWWRREEDGGVFSDRKSEQEVRWREIVRETLETPLDQLQVPARFTPGECDAGVAS